MWYKRCMHTVNTMYKRVYVEITNICNMHCSFCHGHHRAPMRMDMQTFSHILSELKGKTEYLYYHLMGEPLTHPLLPAFLRLAKAEGFHSAITTNGTLLPQHGQALLAEGLYKVSVSLHSFEEGSAADLLQYLDGVIQFAQKASAADVIVSLRLWNKGCVGDKNAAILAYLRKKIDGEWKENSRGYRIRQKLYLEWGDRFGWPDLSAAVQGKQFFCYGMRDHFGILCDGSVVPCCLDSEGCITLGNVLTQPLAEILASPRAVAMYEGFSRRCATEELCRRCAYAQRFIRFSP